MSDSDGRGVSSIPKWDGKAESYSRYKAKVEACAEMWDCADAFDAVAMRNCPTKAEYDALTESTEEEKKKAKLFKANRRMCAVMTLGQDSEHGLAAIQRTKSDDHPHGKAWKIVEAMMAKHKPCDASAEIQLDADLNGIVFRDAQQYYYDVVAVLAKYDVVKSDTDVIKIMAKKVQNFTFANLIIMHLSSHNPDDLEALCDEIAAIQRLTRTTGSESQKQSTGKEVSLNSTSGTFLGTCNRCRKKTGYKAADCPCKNKGSSGGSNKKCNNCGGNHKEERCWKKHPEKAPEWYKTKLLAKKNEAEASGADIEITLAELNLDAKDFGRARL